MGQNIYDDPDFFAGYRHLRETASGLNEVLEQPALRALLPDLADRSLLELGCGMGQFARWCVEQGAGEVLGIDISENMLTVARQENALPQITYLQAALETLNLPENAFDVIVSSLALHYVEDYAALVSRIYTWLKPAGCFVFSVEHPIFTAARSFQGWSLDAQGRKSCWTLDNYAEEGQRTRAWFVAGVVKYHRTLATYLNTLIRAGFQIAQVEEPEAVPEAIAARPDLVEESRRPPFLLIKAMR